MRSPDAHPPVIYGTFFHEGVRESEILDGIAPDRAWPSLAPGRHVGRLQRSDGCRAEVQFVVGPKDSPHRLRSTVLEAADGRWKADPVVGELSLARENLRLAFWHGHSILPDALTVVDPTQAVKTVDATAAALVLAGDFGSTTAATMQVVTGDGASYFIRIPPAARQQGIHVRLCVHHVPNDSDQLDPPVPMPVCAGPPSTAYNAFLAFGQDEAAFSLGKAIAEGLATGEGGAGLIDRLVATQWLLRSNIDEAMQSLCMRALDPIVTQSDAATLRWLLAFDTRSTGRETLGSELLTVLERLREEPPIFSETLRLLFERLPTARARLRAKEAWVPEHETGYRFAMRFARALVWPSILTTYRGTRPNQPDRSANEDVATSKKKAVGVSELGSLLIERDSICVVQVKSSIRRPKVQGQTLRGLGLGRLNHARILKDTPAVRGMIRTVSHLVVVVSFDDVRELGSQPQSGRRFGIPGGTLPTRLLASRKASRFLEAAE